MRVHRDALLTLPALLSAFVVAVPSPPAAYSHEPFNSYPTPQLQSRWRSLSDRVIESIWGAPKGGDGRSAKQNGLADQALPPQVLARYSNDVVLRFNVSSADEAASLAEAADALLLDIWDFTHDWLDIRLAKDVVPLLLGLLPPTLQHSHNALLSERHLAQAIYNTYPTVERPTITSGLSHSRERQVTPLLQGTTDDAEASIFFKEYRPLSAIEPWMQLLSREFSGHVRLINIGSSYEGRDILGMRVGAHPGQIDDLGPKKRKTVLITGGMHAREWISTSTVNYVAFHLITSYGQTPGVTELLKEYDFVFLPTLNPDGYAYTWEIDRLWRKNRQQTTVRFCPGIDIDHGFGFEWDSVSTAGNPCSESYAGEAPFDAVESQRLADWARNETENNNVEFVGFLDLHSYSQQILYPYSYSCDDAPPSQENLEELALGMEKAIRRSSSLSYESMAACEGNVAVSDGNGRAGKRTLLPRIEAAGGSALDWFYHEMHVKYAYQIKLRDRGTYGFLLPKENIVPTGKEILEAVLYLGEFLKEGYPKLVESENEEGDERLSSTTTAAHEAVDEGELRELDMPEDTRWDLRRRIKR